jgi:hypothetical protein
LSIGNSTTDASSNQVNTSASLSIDISSGSLAIDCLTKDTELENSTAGAGQTELHKNNSATGTHESAASYKSGGAVSWSWSTASRYAYCVLEILKAPDRNGWAGGGAGARRRREELNEQPPKNPPEPGLNLAAMRNINAARAGIGKILLKRMKNKTHD